MCGRVWLTNASPELDNGISFAVVFADAVLRLDRKSVVQQSSEGRGGERRRREEEERGGGERRRREEEERGGGGRRRDNRRVAEEPVQEDVAQHQSDKLQNLRFPPNYPFEPPDFRFTRTLWHPIFYADRCLCMYPELAHVLISVFSLFDDLEFSSRANVDKGVQLRRNSTAYKIRKKTPVETFSCIDSEVMDDFGGSESDKEIFDEADEDTKGDRDD
ncbi:hypothetical protein D0864_11578 [Hortaea werneckii]|uniref:UBC core domain-containing protein n=1 Tax=Hortaea werneckii TaxID=91943 RepID=A0A3M7DTS2_HORWE|nr:hypothetical protein D0864_11578 [Hortaea werneckii]